MRHLSRPALLALVAICLATVAARAQDGTAAGEWPYYGGDRAFTRYSPLDQIDADTVHDLEIVWRRPATAPQWTEEAFPELEPYAYLRSTPVMIGGVLYAPNALGLLEAMDPGTGELLLSASNRASRG